MRSRSGRYFSRLQKTNHPKKVFFLFSENRVRQPLMSEFPALTKINLEVTNIFVYLNYETIRIKYEPAEKFT